MKKTKKKGRGWKVLGIIVGVFCLLLGTHHLANAIAVSSLRKYIESFEKVQYTDQLTPTTDEKGYVSFTVDEARDFKVMEINDIHLGGGYATAKQDKKVVYEVMSMVTAEKPDLVILCGDSIFAVPSIVFNGGGTLNNLKVSRQIMYMFDTLGVYYAVTFGNHDTESFDLVSRQKLANHYMRESEYCVLQQDFTDYGVTNQIITVRNNDANKTLRKALLIMDSNDYVDNSIMASINWLYDTIHDNQVEWAKTALNELGTGGEAAKSLAFFHIPVGEFQIAYAALEESNFAPTTASVSGQSIDVEYIGGSWNELVDEAMGGRIWYGGCSQDLPPEDVDNFIEVLGPRGNNSLEGVFVGHDHVNNGVVSYEGILLSYGYSLDNIAYSDIQNYAKQRGCTVINIEHDGTWSQIHKQAYAPVEDGGYGLQLDKFYEQDLTADYYEQVSPAN